jgi:hypothetical protein
LFSHCVRNRLAARDQAAQQNVLLREPAAAMLDLMSVVRERATVCELQ